MNRLAAAALVWAPHSVEIVAPEGYVWGSFDYSQLELFILSHILKKQFGDESLKNDLEGGDVHTATALRCWPHLEPGSPELKEYRGYAKVVNYGVNYGKGPSGLALQLEVPVWRAEEILADYYAAYPGILEYKNWIHDFAATYGWVPTLAGRQIYLPDALHRDKAALRAALNYPIQGSAADIVMIALTNCDRDLTPRDVRFTLQVHDELNFEIPENLQEAAANRILFNMEKAWPELEVSLRVDGELGRSWAG